MQNFIDCSDVYNVWMQSHLEIREKIGECQFGQNLNNSNTIEMLK